MLIREPVHAAIWHCLNHYDFEDATFLAERLFSEVETEDSLHLLATCYYRSGRVREAHHLLQNSECQAPQTRFLMAKCCQELNLLSECESVLSAAGGNAKRGESAGGGGPRQELTPERLVEEFGDAAPFALRILSGVFGATERRAKATDYDRRALDLHPLLWSAFRSLCDRGNPPDPYLFFSTTKLDSLDHVLGVNNILSLYNQTAAVATTSSPPPVPTVSQSATVTSTPNNPSGNNPYSTPVLPQVPITPAAPPQIITPVVSDPKPAGFDTTPRTTMAQSRMLSGIQALNFSTDSAMSNSDTSQMSQPRLSASKPSSANFLVPQPQRKRVRGVVGGNKAQDPQRQQQPSEAAAAQGRDDSFGTPTFGVLPQLAHLTAKVNEGGRGPKVALKLDFSSPSLSVLSPCLTGAVEAPSQVVTKAPVKEKRSVTSSKENPLKPSVAFGQSGNVANQNITPSVRRSSRLFGSTQSVKENSTKQQSPKKTNRNNPKTPAVRRPKGRVALASQQETEKNERNKVPEREKDQLEKLEDIDEAKKPVSPPQKQSQQQATVQQQQQAKMNAALSGINLKAQALVIQKEALGGLLQLMGQVGRVYLELSKYNCREALTAFDSVPEKHRSKGWVLGLKGKAHFELAEYSKAKSVFKEVHCLDPYRMDYMEYYSTSLWHLQDDVGLSSLSKELTKIGRDSPQAWCAAGNCFSQLREHENAIKFFQRAVQVDPSFAYAYTLLGHEYVLIEELDKALACFRSAVRIDARHYNAWYGVGLTYLKQERLKLADIYFRKALGINRTNPILMCHVAVVQQAMKQTDKALETFAEALKISPRNSLLIFERATTLYSAERFDEALKELTNLKELAPKEALVYFLLGKVYDAMDSKTMALRHYSWSTDLDPKGANTQIKDALDPLLNRAAQDLMQMHNESDEGEEMQVQLSHIDDGEEEEDEDQMHDMSESFNPPGGAGDASTSQESLYGAGAVGEVSIAMEEGDDSTAAVMEGEDEGSSSAVGALASASSLSHQDSLMPRAEVTPPPSGTERPAVQQGSSSFSDGQTQQDVLDTSRNTDDSL